MLPTGAGKRSRRAGSLRAAMRPDSRWAAEVVEYRVEQYAAKLRDRLAAVQERLGV